MLTAAQEAAIRDHYPMPADIRKHASRANFDLYYGPTYEPFEDGTPYSFTDSASIVGEWFNSLDTIYLDLDSDFISTSEPEGEYCEDEDRYYDPPPYCIIEPRDIAAAFGYRELFTYA